MDALVLCGGSGTRVRELTQDEIPKVMIPYKGKPLVDHIIEAISKLKEIGRIFLCAGFKADILEAYIQQHHRNFFLRSPSVYVVAELKPLGTGGALFNLCKSGECISKYVLVVNGDCLVTSVDIQSFKNKEADGMVYCTRVEDSKDYGLIRTGSLSRIIDFNEKEEGAGLINCGWYILRSDLLKNGAPETCSLEYDLIPGWLEQHRWIEAKEIPNEEFIDLGTTDKINKHNS